MIPRRQLPPTNAGVEPRGDEIVLVNAFGLTFENVAVASAVHEAAIARGPGLRLPR